MSIAIGRRLFKKEIVLPPTYIRQQMSSVHTIYGIRITYEYSMEGKGDIFVTVPMSEVAKNVLVRRLGGSDNFYVDDIVGNQVVIVFKEGYL